MTQKIVDAPARPSKLISFIHPVMKPSLFFVIAALACLIARSVAADPETERVRKGAEANSAALAAGNYDRVADYTNPKIVEMIGGHDKVVELLRHGTDEMKSRGASIEGADVTEPKEVIPVGHNRYAIVPMVLKIKAPQGTVRSKGFLVAVSGDDGKTWTFIDGAGLTKEKITELLPDFPSDLSLPSPEKPVVEPN